MLLQLLACTLEGLLQLIHVFLVHNAAVVAAFQLHLGQQHQTHGEADGERGDFDKGSLAFGEWMNHVI